MSYGKNSAWRMTFDDGFADDIRKLGRTDQLRIKRYLEKLQTECGNPKDRGSPLRSSLAGFWRYRIGDYRLLCQITHKPTPVLCLLAVTHRSSAYSLNNMDEIIRRARALSMRLDE